MARRQLNVNVAAIFIQALAVFLLVVAIVLPSWLSNPAGLSNYPYSRTWGLFHVIGRRRITHQVQWTTMCAIFGQMTLGVACTSPLCMWYNQKCGAYRLVLIISYTVVGLLLVGCLCTGASIFFSLRRAKRALTFSTVKEAKGVSKGLSGVGIFLTVAALVAYVFTMGEAFAMINSAGYYPVPQPAVSMILTCVSVCMMVAGCILHAIRLRTISREAEFIQQTKYEYLEARAQLGL